MSRPGEPVATVDPGVVRAIFDHLIIALTPDGQPGPPVFLFSHYRFRWAKDGIVGELAFVELDGRRFVLTDAPVLATGQAGRLSPAAWTDKPIPAATSARFESSGFGAGTLTERVTFDGMALGLEWSGLASPIVARGPAPRVPAEDILSVLIEAEAARATADRHEVAGRPFPNEAWMAWLGRPLSSAIVAIGEVLIARP